MTGLVLCGGQSSRMGSDKGLIETNSFRWAQTAVEKIQALDLDVYISVNAAQFRKYATIFLEERLINDNAAIKLHGPLLGILSAHMQMPLEDLLVLACDMPLMETSILQQLCAVTKKYKADAFLFTNEGSSEPLCAVYTAGGLTHIMELLHTHKLSRHSMKYVLEQLTFHAVELQPEQKQYFRNFNERADLNNL